jgi:hypothetical protein
MNLYLISQNKVSGYDTYDSAVVSAESEADARAICPSYSVTHVSKNRWMGTFSAGGNKGKEYIVDPYDWIAYKDIKEVTVKFLGETKEKRGVILSSYNAG